MDVGDHRLKDRVVALTRRHRHGAVLAIAPGLDQGAGVATIFLKVELSQLVQMRGDLGAQRLFDIERLGAAPLLHALAPVAIKPADNFSRGAQGRPEPTLRAVHLIRTP